MANEFVPRQQGELIENAVTLLLPSGEIFEGWENMQVTKSLESISNTFSFQFDDRFQVSNKVWPFRPGDLVRVNIGDERVVTGRIDQLSASFSANSRNITVSGRSLSSDLVDCTVVPPYEILNKSVIGIAEELVEPYGLDVLTSVESKTIDKFSLKPGETVFTALDRAARTQGFFWVATRAGNIRLTRISRARASSEIHQDVNMLSGSINFNENERYRDYKVIGNAQGTEESFGINVSEPEGSAQDLGIERFRPLTIVAEAPVNTDQANDRAQWESAVRLAKGMSLECVVQGWRQVDGILWGINQLTRVRSKFLGVDSDFLISNVSHVKNNQSGTITRISLRRQDAYQPQPTVPKEDDLKFFLGPGAVQ